MSNPWFAIFIPILLALAATRLFKHKLLWWEVLLPTVVTALFILIAKFSYENSVISDTQYKGAIIVEARYYEYWETWVNKTCTETYACGTYSSGSGKNRRTHTKYCTRTYDCSYCDRNSAYWEVVDSEGRVWTISKKEYDALMKQWKSTPEFVELNRSINYHGSCGKDGDMYRIKWDKDPMTSENTTISESYDNYVQVSKSHFGIREIEQKDISKYHLYDYPSIDGFNQKFILGLDSLNYLNKSLKLGAEKHLGYFNGVYGSKRKIRVYVCLFFTENITAGIKQKDYWLNGNKNEVVITLGVNRNTGEIYWCYPFSWSENKRIVVDLREEIMANPKRLNFTRLFQILEKETKDFKYNDLKKYEYLTIDISPKMLWFIYIFVIVMTVGILYYGIQNEFENV